MDLFCYNQMHNDYKQDENMVNIYGYMLNI